MSVWSFRKGGGGKGGLYAVCVWDDDRESAAFMGIGMRGIRVRASVSDVVFIGFFTAHTHCTNEMEWASSSRLAGWILGAVKVCHVFYFLLLEISVDGFVLI
jgi:hypothetical protein